MCFFGVGGHSKYLCVTGSGWQPMVDFHRRTSESNDDNITGRIFL